MSAVQDVIGQRQRGLRRLIRWFAGRLATAGHADVTDCVRAGHARLRPGPDRLGAHRYPLRVDDLALFAALLAAAVLCVEAIRRLGQPSGVSRDLLSAWWLPIALLLPPLYALVAPFVVGAVLYARGRRTPVYRRVFSSAALGLAGARASTTFHGLSRARVRSTLNGSHDLAEPPGGDPDHARLRDPVRRASTRAWWRSPRTWPSRRRRSPRCSGTGRACCST